MNKNPVMKSEIWTMHTAGGFYPVQPSIFCKPEDHGKLNGHVLRIEDSAGKVLWERPKA